MLLHSRNKGLEGDEDRFARCLAEVPRPDGEGGWRIAPRRIVPDYVTISAQNLSILF